MTPGHSLGSRLLSQWRANAGITQREAIGPSMLDLDHGRYSAFEGGRARPGLETAVRIERITGVPVESWLQPDPEAEHVAEAQGAA